MIYYTHMVLTNKKAFTLIEILSAVIIVAVGVISVGALFFNSMYFLAEIREISAATQAAHEEMETIRDLPYSDLTAMGTSSSFTAAALSNLSQPTGTVTIDNIYSNDYIRRVTVTVSWVSLRGRTISRRLVTLVADGGVSA